jgi:hypothetical protein
MNIHHPLTVFTIASLSLYLLGTSMKTQGTIDSFQNAHKVAVCMWYDDAISEYADIARTINQKYCDKHGFDLVFSNTRNSPDRHPSWECMSLLRDVLHTRKYDYVMWIDADACFNFKSTYSIEAMIEENANKDIIFSADDPESGIPINAGVILLKTTDYAIDFCNQIIDSEDIQECREKYNTLLWEQDCVNHLYAQDMNNIKEKSVIIPFKQFQIFPSRVNNQIGNALILHYAGDGPDVRKRELSRILSETP